MRITDVALRKFVRKTLFESMVNVPRLTRDAYELLDQANLQLPVDKFDSFYDEITSLIDELETGETTPAASQRFKMSIENVASRYGIKRFESGKAHNVDDILSNWVENSDTVGAPERRHLANVVAGSKLSVDSIERVMSDPGFEVGEIIDWTGDVVSFSKLRFSKGASVYQFHAGKGSCVLQIVQPTRGLAIDYDKLKHTFGRRGENEVLVTGKYRVVSKRMANEVPIYIFKEA